MNNRIILFAAVIAVSSFAAVPSFACTTVIVSAKASGTGRPLLWKNQDAESAFCHIEHFKGAKYGFTGLVDSGDDQHNVWAGGNDAGFCIVNNLSYNLRPSDYEGKPMHAGAIMREALGCCATVDEFAEFLETAKSQGVSSNFGVIDAHGGAAYFEVWDKGCTRFDVSGSSDGYLFRTNFSISGSPDGGKGYARYETVSTLLKTHPSNGISAEWLLDKVGRSFYNSVSGKDLLKGTHGLVEGDERIPRYTNISSIVFEGVGECDAPSSTVMWTVLGYAPCSYSVPVWVAAASRIPRFLTDDDPGPFGYPVSAADSLSVSMKRYVYCKDILSRDAVGKYVNVDFLRKMLPIVRSAEHIEFVEARCLDYSFRSRGFDPEAVSEYNSRAEERFERYRMKIRKMAIR